MYVLVFFGSGKIVQTERELCAVGDLFPHLSDVVRDCLCRFALQFDPGAHTLA